MENHFYEFAVILAVFISQTTKNAAFVDKLVARPRDHYITTWYTPRHMPGGYVAENLRQSLGGATGFSWSSARRRYGRNG